MIAQAGREHHLRIIARRAVAIQRVVADQVRSPLHTARVDVHEQRRVGRHDDHITVALHASHKRGIAQRGSEVGCRRPFARSPLADKDLRAVAIGLVIVARFLEHALLALVIVVVDDVGLHAVHRHRGDDLHVWILALDRLVELRIAAVVGFLAVEIVLVADFDVAQLERLRMPVLRAYRAPLGLGVAGDVLDLFHPFLHVRIKIRTRLHQLASQRISRINSEHRFHAQVFAPLQEFQQAHAIR